MKYRYIILDINGDFTGTNDSELAKYLNNEGECNVVDAEMGLTLDGQKLEEAVED